MAVPSVESVPAELRSLHQWVCWRYEEREGKHTKVPYDPKSRRRASATDADTWSSLVEAITTGQKFDGIGFVVTARDLKTGVDLDHCVEAGIIAPWAMEIIQRLNSYTEVTPSGTGVRIWVRGKLPPGPRRRGQVEMYDAGRYFTVTGNHVPGTPTNIADRQAELDALYATVFQPKEKTTLPPAPITPVDAGTDTDVRERIMRSSHDGARFSRLLAGDISDYNGDHSAADLAMMNLLAFYTRGDTAQMERLFRQSGLAREKLDERHRADGATYLQMTIEKALGGRTQFWAPQSGNEAWPDFNANTSTEPPKENFPDKPNGQARLEAAIQAGTVEAAFAVVDVLAAMSLAECGVAKSRLKQAVGKTLNGNDLTAAVAEYRRKRRTAPTIIPIARPKRPPVAPATLEDVIAAYREWLFLPEDGAIKIALAAVIANRGPGDPVWLMLVAPPGLGKTEHLAPLAELDDVFAVGTITEPGLLSATPTRDRTHGASGGLLRQVGDFGILLLKDFGSILSMNLEARAQALAALREIYDGRWARAVGSDGGQLLSWQGKCGLLAAVTPKIDDCHGVLATLGERFVYYRPSEDEAEKRTTRALEFAGKEEDHRARAAFVVRGLMENARIPSGPPPMTEPERQSIVALAQWAAQCRSAVDRDPRTREITNLPGPESPTRIVKVLALLLGGLDAIGVPRREGWELIRRVANDSMPKLRRKCVSLITQHTATQKQEPLSDQEPLTTREIATTLGYPTTTTRRSLEDLAAYGVLGRQAASTAENAPDHWELSSWAARVHEIAFQPLCVPEMSTGVRIPPTLCSLSPSKVSGVGIPTDITDKHVEGNRDYEPGQDWEVDQETPE